ncbi:GNAT family N-acetyltransferase [Emticicia fontis]
MRKYAILNTRVFSTGKYSIVPLRDEDKYDIMKWRNEQIYHLRQSEPLTTEKQEWYFSNVVANLFEQEKPTQILFSYLENDICIGYGGLVHINWIDKNAEISFIINTALEKDFFEFHWTTYFSLIEKVAFEELNLHKIYTYSFNLRPHLYPVLQKNNYQQEAMLHNHCLFEGKFVDVFFHSKFNPINIRKAGKDDLMLYFEWTNDEEVRKQSFNSESIVLENHEKWFHKKLVDKHCLMLVFEDKEQTPIGQVRFESNEEQKISVIGVSVDKNFRGQKLANKILALATTYFFKEHPDYTIQAFIKVSNEGSINAFKKAGFSFEKELDYQGIASVLYTKSNQ